LTATASPTTRVSGGGGPGIQQGWASPNPAHGPLLQLRLKHLGPADAVRLRLYTAALVLVAQGQGAGSPAAGMAACQLALPVGLARGVYYLQASAMQGSAVSAPALIRFYYQGP
jgi:hypothetical protein